MQISPWQLGGKCLCSMRCPEAEKVGSVSSSHKADFAASPFFFLQCISWDVIGCFLFSCSHQRPFENFTQNILLSWASSISPSAVRNFILFTSVVKIQKKKFEADLKTTVTYQWLPLVNYKPEGENRPMAHLFVFFPTLRAFSCHLIN